MSKCVSMARFSALCPPRSWRLLERCLSFKSGGPWGHKPLIDALIERQAGKPVTKSDRYLRIPGHKERIDRDIWSNIHYGYVGKLTIGTPINDLGDAVFGGVNDPGDRLSIKIGYELADKFPEGNVPEGAITASIVEHLDEYVGSTDKVR